MTSTNQYLTDIGEAREGVVVMGGGAGKLIKLTPCMLTLVHLMIQAKDKPNH